MGGTVEPRDPNFDYSDAHAQGNAIPGGAFVNGPPIGQVTPSLEPQVLGNGSKAPLNPEKSLLVDRLCAEETPNE